MPLRGLAKAKNFTLGPTAPMKTFTENIHIQTKESNNFRNSGKSHKLTNNIQNENLFRYESKIKSDFDEIVPTLKEIARIQHHEDFINKALKNLDLNRIKILLINKKWKLKRQTGLQRRQKKESHQGLLVKDNLLPFQVVQEVN